MLSGGFSCTWDITPEYRSLRNVGVQAGSYVFSDWVSHSIEGLEVFDYALTVLTRCISRPKSNEAIFDAGIVVALNMEKTMPELLGLSSKV